MSNHTRRQMKNEMLMELRSGDGVKDKTNPLRWDKNKYRANMDSEGNFQQRDGSKNEFKFINTLE